MLLVNGGNHKGINSLRYRQLVLFFFFSCLCSVYGQSPSEIETVENLDIRKYLGVWHQIALIPNYFQKDCVDDTQAEYEILSDDSITILNSCLLRNGERLGPGGQRVYTSRSWHPEGLLEGLAPRGLGALAFTLCGSDQSRPQTIPKRSQNYP